MKQSRASIRYAKAYLEVANDRNSLDQAAADMLAIQETVAASKELSGVLENPMTSPILKKSILDELFKDLSEATKDLIRVLSENDRLELLDDIAERFVSLLAKHRGQVRVTLVIASADQQDALEKTVLNLLKEQGYANVILKVELDPELIGGFVLKLDDLLYDASVAGKIKRVKKEFSNSL
ncbi:MAG: ATP synthase F1 subunit delta [Flavobacteriaceae bacterium]|jgi:F-type H+-transporting ATPase subunit delta